MPRWRRRPSLIAAAALVGALMVAVVLVALDFDALSLVLGAAIVAAAFIVVVGAWLEPARRSLRLVEQRERRAGRMARKRAVRARKDRATLELRLFWQLEALGWLREELDLRQPLPPTRGAAAAPDALLELVRLIDQRHPQVVLELGSGVSTIVAAARLKAAGSGRVFALEHEPRYGRATREQLTAQGLEDTATVIDAPLVETVIGDETWRWYEIGSDVPERVDLLFVDGPPAGVGPLSRYPALPRLRERLAPGATIFVDDGRRPDEQEMVRRWSDEVDGIAVRELPLTKGAWLLTMPE